MTYKDISTLNHEIGVLQGIAILVQDNGVADALFASAEVLTEIADKMMKEVAGNETA